MSPVDVYIGDLDGSRLQVGRSGLSLEDMTERGGQLKVAKGLNNRTRLLAVMDILQSKSDEVKVLSQ